MIFTDEAIPMSRLKNKRSTENTFSRSIEQFNIILKHYELGRKHIKMHTACSSDTYSLGSLIDDYNIKTVVQFTEYG